MTGPAPRWLTPVAGVAARVYAAEVARRNRAFDAGRRVIEIDRPVISVGNLTTGGTGKSPMVAAIIDMLTAAGHTPAIAMRGYRARGGLSDEADAYVRRFPAVSVVAQRDRLAGLIQLFAHPEGEATDVVVLDDGFQHRRIARQFDLVLIDAAATPGVFDDQPLPLGWLRESPAGLARAHGVVLTHADRVDAGRRAELRARCLAVNPRLVVAEARHAWSGVDIGDAAGSARVEPVAMLKGLRVVTVCAIGQPQRFIDAVCAAGAEVVGQATLRDHDAYAPSTLRGIARLAREARAEALVTTDKDWSKLRRAAPALAPDLGLPWLRPRLDLEFLSGHDEITAQVRHTAALRLAGDDGE